MSNMPSIKSLTDDYRQKACLLASRVTAISRKRRRREQSDGHCQDIQQGPSVDGSNQDTRQEKEKETDSVGLQDLHLPSLLVAQELLQHHCGYVPSTLLSMNPSAATNQSSIPCYLPSCRTCGAALQPGDALSTSVRLVTEPSTTQSIQPQSDVNHHTKGKHQRLGKSTKRRLARKKRSMRLLIHQLEKKRHTSNQPPLSTLGDFVVRYFDTVEGAAPTVVTGARLWDAWNHTKKTGIEITCKGCDTSYRVPTRPPKSYIEPTKQPKHVEKSASSKSQTKKRPRDSKGTGMKASQQPTKPTVTDKDRTEFPETDFLALPVASSTQRNPSKATQRKSTDTNKRRQKGTGFNQLGGPKKRKKDKNPLMNFLSSLNDP